MACIDSHYKTCMWFVNLHNFQNVLHSFEIVHAQFANLSPKPDCNSNLSLNSHPDPDPNPNLTPIIIIIIIIIVQ